MSDSYVMLNKVKIKDYKSISWCDVSLEPLTILVGKNGSGKSNFIDALRFLSDSLSVSLGYALGERDGFENIKRTSKGHIKSIAIGVEVHL
jgi:predicted ATPase